MLLKHNLKTGSNNLNFSLCYMSSDLLCNEDCIYLSVDSVLCSDENIFADMTVILHDSNLDNLLSKCINFLRKNNLNLSFKIDKFYSKNLLSAQLEIKDHVIKMQSR